MEEEAPLSINIFFYGDEAEFLAFSEALPPIFDKGSVYHLEREEPSGSECLRWEIPDLRITWHGMPGKRELLILGDFFSRDLSSPAEEGPEMETALWLFVGRLCPFCPGVLRKVLSLLPDKKIFLDVIDAESCPEMTIKYHVRSVPTLMIAGDEHNFKWVGDVALQDLKAALKTRELGEESLKNILESGEAERLISMMKEKGEIFPSFYNLLFHEKWSVRLGAMVVAETLAEEGEDLGETLLEEIWAKKDSLGQLILGDMIYLMGQGKPSTWVPRLEKLFLEVPEGELKSAIEEALQSLREKG